MSEKDNPSVIQIVLNRLVTIEAGLADNRIELERKLEANRIENKADHADIFSKINSMAELNVDIAKLQSNIETLNAELLAVKARPEKVLEYGRNHHRLSCGDPGVFPKMFGG